MANTYIKASFVIAVTVCEADLLHKACEAAEQIADNTIDESNRAERFAEFGSEFGKTFPPTNDDPFSGFLAIFDDPAYPAVECQIEITEREPGRHEAAIFGDQINANVLAQLIFHVCKSALPTGFEYAIDCDRLRPGELGGGYVVITETGIEHSGTSAMLDAALRRASDEGADGFVLTIRHPEHGLSFWNHDTGFGRLATATVFSEEDAGRFDKPIADDEPEWLAMPPPLRL
jgi:hypothetical protein